MGRLSRDKRTGRFCYGDAPGLADVCLIAHLTSAQVLYGCPVSAYPTVHRIFKECMSLKAFVDAHPNSQVDVPSGAHFNTDT
jgi:maleylacetoacetate isomerase